MEKKKIYRAAVASSDGIVVNRHFGKADRFLIYDVYEDDSMELWQERLLNPVCSGGSHDEEQLEKNIFELSDCNYVIVSRIGPGAADALSLKGIEAFELPGIIEESISRLSGYIKVQVLCASYLV